MAKQIGIHRIKGKVDGRSYYNSQVGGDLSRNINQGMSQRVKTAPEFLNTRLNASEFGGAGKAAGQIIRPVSQRWRYLLNPIATGDLAKLIKQLMARDTNNPWGERQVLLSDMPLLQERYNSMSKNPMIASVVAAMASGTVADDTTEFTLADKPYYLTSDEESYFRGIGAEGVEFHYWDFRARLPQFNPASGKYEVQSLRNDFTFIQSYEVEIGSHEAIADRLDVAIGLAHAVPQNSAAGLGGVLCVMLPFKVVSNEKYILQQHCACYWTSYPDAE